MVAEAERSNPEHFATVSHVKDSARSPAASGSSISDSVARGREGISNAAAEAMNAASTDLQSLRADLNSLKDTLAKFMCQAGGEAAKSAREVTANVASRGTEMASTTSEQVKSFPAELENMMRRNPIGALAGAVVIGVLIGMMGRRS